MARCVRTILFELEGQSYDRTALASARLPLRDDRGRSALAFRRGDISVAVVG